MWISWLASSSSYRRITTNRNLVWVTSFEAVDRGNRLSLRACGWNVYHIAQAFTSVSCTDPSWLFRQIFSTDRQQQPTRYPPPHQMVGFPSAPSPPPAVLAAAPSYRPPEALRGNCVPSVLSVSKGGYRLNDFF
ncbi:unnamed protein product [Boreogadus saida]